MAKGRIIPNFTKGIGPDNPRNQPDKIFFPARTSDGPARTVRNSLVPHLQAGTGALEGVAVAYNRPVIRLQANRVYSPSRRVCPRAF